ncbi:hypothetical protein E0K54_24350 [Escherichia coli]|nr:hypothetical protein E0K54_24350 [Escherichia coli]
MVVFLTFCLNCFLSGFVVFKKHLCCCCVFYPACRFIFFSWGIHSVLIRSHWCCSMVRYRKVLPR